MPMTIDELVAQSIGAPHEGGLVVDNPTTATFDWGKAGWNPDLKPNSDRPPAGMTEITGYLHGYNVMGKPVVPCNIHCRNMQVWVRAGGVWTRVEYQADGRAFGGGYFSDMKTNSTSGPIVFSATQSDGSVFFKAPPANNNGHWWRVPRGKLPAGVDATVMCAELRVDNVNANLIYGAGTDWWKVGGGWPGGNAAALAGSFIKLTDQYRWVGCTNLSKAELSASRPAIIATSVVVPPAPPPPPPAPVAVYDTIMVGGTGKPGSAVTVSTPNVNSLGNWSATIKVQKA